MNKFKGIYKDLTNDDYHGEREHLSSSNLKMLLKNPEQFKKEKIDGEYVPRKSNVFDEGSLAHAYILEPHLIDKEFAFWNEFRKANPKGTKEFDQFKNANKGKVIISKPQRKRVENWVKGYYKNKTAVELIETCEPELSLFGELNDVPIKVRADAINIEQGYIADVKTTAYDSDLDGFKMVMDQFGYDLSGALYAEMFSRHFNKEFDFYFVVLGKKDCSCEVFKMSEETMNKGRMAVKKALSLYKKCKKTGIWKSDKNKFLAKCYDDYEILEV